MVVAGGGGGLIEDFTPDFLATLRGVGCGASAG